MSKIRRALLVDSGAFRPKPLERSYDSQAFERDRHRRRKQDGNGQVEISTYQVLCFQVSQELMLSEVNYYRLKAVALESGCKPAKDRRRYESPHPGVLYLGARYTA